MSEISDIGMEIRKWLRVLTYATIALYVVLAAIFVYFWLSSIRDRDELRREEAKTTAALCTLRRDLETRVASSKDFLKNNPHGIPGIPAKLLKSTIKGQESTINALDILVCHPAHPKI